MMRYRWTSGLLFLLLGLLFLPSPIPAQGSAVLGVGTHGLDDTSRQRLLSLGVRAIRTTLYWMDWESSPSYRESISRQIEQAGREGFDLLVVVHGQPARFNFGNRDEAFEAYADFMGFLAARFPQVGAWQLWNEMDVPAFTDLFGARGELSAEAGGRLYGEMLEKAFRAVKRANPRALVVTGGLAGPIDSGFAAGLLRSGAPMDALAIHTYGFPVVLAVEQRGPAARALLDRLGRSTTELWVTEFGMEEAVIAPGFDRSPNAIDRYHLEAWRDPVSWNARTGTFDRMYGHVLQQDGDRSFDLIRRNGSLRPAAEWLRDYLR